MSEEIYIPYSLMCHKGLNLSEKLLLAILINEAGEHNYCTLDKHNLAKALRLTIRTIERHFKNLVSEGFLRLEDGRYYFVVHEIFKGAHNVR